jgi:hypothetical protein
MPERKRILRGLSLTHISAVDNPCQEGAKAVIIKRRDGPVQTAKGSWLARSVAKYVGSDDGAHTFAEVLSENRFDQAIWPMTDALSQSIRSIMGDKTLSAADRDAKITASVDEFLTAVRALDPPASGEASIEKVERQLRELISKGNQDMAKTVEQLQAEIDTLKGEITTLKSERDTAVSAKTTAETALETEKAAHVTTKAALVTATDETLKVGDREIKKSAVGEDMFAVMKAQEDRAEIATLEKRAGDEFAHVPGTVTEKAAVLKAVAAMPEPVRKTFDTIIGAAEKMARAGFDRIGGNAGPTPSAKAAQVDFDSKVDEIAKRDDIPRTEAMRKARTEHADLFAQTQGDEAAPVAN